MVPWQLLADAEAVSEAFRRYSRRSHSLSDNWLLIAVMISLAQTVLGVATVIQFVVMLVNNKRPNQRLADFGTDLGIWVAKAARFQTAASNVKPWPWSELD